jgi:DNA-binding NtrC family response regulator
MHRVLVVDDDNGLRLTVAHALEEANYIVEQAQDGEEAVNKVRAGNYNLVLLDVNMPKMSGLEALKEIKAFDPSIIVIMLTAYANIRDAIEATKEGAYNYLEKPIKTENLVYLIDKALKAHNMVKAIQYSSPIVNLPQGTTFVGQNAEMKKIFAIIDKVSRVDTPVLIRGESGTGKELVANAIHYNSPRKDERFVAINCSAIPENLVESEFFGHEKGAFTGADTRRIGKFQYADGGTLFLDEIGDISPAMQVKLLRVLQEKRFTPVGSNKEIEVNVRIIAATNRDLETMVKKGEFREDLFYRLNVLPIMLPPLRQRKDDIEHLANYFIEKFNQTHKKNIKSITKEAMDALKAYNWPGNIRELENVIEHAFVIETTNEITLSSLPENILQMTSTSNLNVPGLTKRGEELLSQASHSTETQSNQKLGLKLEFEKLDFEKNKEEFEKQFLINALKAFKGKINQTALHANIPKKTLLRKLEKYGINAKDYSS